MGGRGAWYLIGKIYTGLGVILGSFKLGRLSSMVFWNAD